MVKYLQSEQQRQSEGSPLIRLIGDEFASNEESQIFLLDGLNGLVVPKVLTANGTSHNAQFEIETDVDAPKHLKGHKVARLIAGENQHFTISVDASTNTELAAGTGSFMWSLDLKKSDVNGVFESIVHYGDEGASEQNWFLRLTSDNVLNMQIDDGTNNAIITDTVPNRFGDQKWHNIIMFVDRTADFMYLIIDGQLIARTSTSAVTLTLDNVGETFHIASNGAGTSTVDGSIANFHFFKVADYNAVQVLNQGIREKVSQGNGLSLATGTALRLNSAFFNTATVADGDYFYTVIDVEEGIYDIQAVTKFNNNQGIMEFDIDGKTILTQDTYNASSSSNNKKIITDLELSAGKHLLKMKVNGKNTASSGFLITPQWISLIKREGHEQGGATKFLLLGDEINQRDNDAGFIFGANTITAYNNQFHDDTAVVGEFTEGDIFIKGGLYRIEFTADRNTNRASHDLDFGDVEVLDQDTTWDGATLGNLTKSVNVRLNQGKTNIRWAVDSVVGGTVFQLSSLRGERISD